MSTGMKIVTVIPLKKGVWKSDLTYFSSLEIPDGSIVNVSLRNSKTLGLVVSSEELSGAKSEVKEMNFNLKKIIEVKEHSIFKKEYIESAFDTAKYFAARKNDVVTHLLPAVLREEYDKISKWKNKELNNSSVQGESTVGGKNIRTAKLLFQAPLPERVSFYKTLIRSSFAQKKSVFIVLPTEHDIKNFHESLSKGIEKFTFYIHSGRGNKKTLERIERVIETEHPVLIIGTAPFLSIPRPDIGVIILEHESSNGYKSISRPHLDLRVFVEIFAAKMNVKFILGDTLLRFETSARSELDGVTNVSPLSFRIDFDGEIKIIGKEPTSRIERKEFKILTDESIKNIERAVDKDRNVFIFSLRKGLATMTVCKDCNNTVLCEKCGAPVVLYLSRDGKKRMFACNRCHREIAPDTACVNCKSWNLMPLGIGTDTVHEKVKEIFQKPARPTGGGKKTKIFKLDRDSVHSAKEAEKIVEEFESTPGSILIGTEMALFYLKEKVHLSIVASFDSFWSIPNFRISEKMTELVISIIHQTASMFIIQTKNVDDPAILAIKSGNLLSFVREELADRKKMDYPPWKRFIKIVHLGDKLQTDRAKELLREIFKGYSPEIFSGFHVKRKGKYVTNTLIKLDPQKGSLPELSLNSSLDQELLSKIMSLPPNFDVFVDPEDLL